MQKVVLKYSNRKLYDKDLKSYISLQDLENYATNNITFSVIEHQTKKDITEEELVKVLANKLNKSSNKSKDSLIALIQNV